MNFFIFGQNEKKQISGDLVTENAPERKKPSEILMGGNRSCSLSDVQNAGNLNFLAFFEKSIIGAHHTTEWASSNRNSLMWSILKSEHSFLAKNLKLTTFPHLKLLIFSYDLTSSKS